MVEAEKPTKSQGQPSSGKVQGGSTRDALWFTLTCISIGLALRAACALQWGHSGREKPPMYGDFEAQRHWMELTIHLPTSEWYYDTPRNNLTYWGLDYPPLTAYHSWLCGKVGDLIDSSWFALETSHGLETDSVRLFMRMTALVSDLLVFFPGAFLVSKALAGAWRAHVTDGSLQQWPQRMGMTMAVLLVNPNTIIIDHGHFQFNAVCLGLMLLGAGLVLNGNELVGSVFFVASLNFKQMALFFAPTFFFFLLGNSFARFGPWYGFIRVAIIGITVMVAFAAMWAPFLFSIEDVMQVVHRIFPLARGLFEDKVSNVWCMLDIVVKLRLKFSVDSLAKLSLAATVLAMLPSGLHLMLRPSPRTFFYALASISLAFFLFSFQVHEKTILLPSVAVSILAGWGKPITATWFNVIAMFSMYPLLERDHLEVAYFALTGFHVVAMLELFKDDFQRLSTAQRLLGFISLLGMVSIHAAMAFVTPPPRWPHLFIVANCAWSCLHFVVFWLYLTAEQVWLYKAKATSKAKAE